MKKIACFLLVVLLLLCCATAYALEAKPGETVTVAIKLKAHEAMMWNCKVKYDKDVLEYVGWQSGLSEQFEEASMTFIGMSGNSGGTVGKVQFKIKENAQPGTTKVSASATGINMMEGTEFSLSASGATITIVADACSHTWDNGTVTTPATCEDSGVKTYTCTNCNETKQETIPPTGHTPGNGGETVQPTCTEDGYTSSTCANCGIELDNVILPALGHDSDGGKVTKKPTCTEKGEKTYTCTRCGKVIKTEEIDPLGHQDDGGKVTKEPTCTEKGEKTYTCTVCGKVTKTEEIAPLGHKPGEWVVVQEATDNQDGLKEQYCTVCGHVVDSQVIPFAKWTNRKVTTAGIRFRDETDLTDEWYMFTPVDLSVEGEQTFDLVAAHKYIIGTVFINVADGQVTVTYEASRRVEMKSDFFTFFPDLASVTTVDETQLTGYTYDEPISIEEQLGGDTKVLLYFNGMALYRNDAKGLDDFAYATKEYKEYVEELKAIMD